MYSYEIDNLIKLRNYIVDNQEYFNICETSPQIDHVRYIPDKFDYNYQLWTTDNYYWKIKVYIKDNSKRN